MSLARTINHVKKAGWAQYWHDLQYIGDAKSGRMVGIDSNGNKYYENNSELIGRTRWVDYKQHDFDATQLDPIWHAWVSHTRATPPSTDSKVQRFEQPWQIPAYENFTGTRGAYRPYNTTRPKIYSWQPMIGTRQG